MADDVSAGRLPDYGLKEKTNMKTNRFTKLLLLSALVLSCAFGVSAQQQTMTQTTLTAAVTGPSFYSGTTPTLQTQITLASSTGIVAPILPGTPSTIIYIDREAMGVFNVNATTGLISVNRGYLGTQAAPHLSGAMVLVAPNYNVTIAQGGNPVPNGLFSQDPPMGSTCTAANTTTSPWVNVLTGAQWLCSSVTGGWVAGFNNPYASDWSGQTATVAAAAGVILPSGPLFIVSGAGAITGFTIPVGCNATAVGACSFTIIAAAGSTWTWTATGNISVIGTGTPLKSFTFIWSASLQKFVPSSVS
jgi:hypothetical protein